VADALVGKLVGPALGLVTPGWVHLVATAETFEMIWLVLSALAGLVALAVEGRLSADQVTWLLFLVVLVTAFWPVAGTAVRALLAILAVYSVVTRYGGDDWRVRAGFYCRIAEIALYLAGIWVMLWGLGRSIRQITRR